MKSPLTAGKTDPLGLSAGQSLASPGLRRNCKSYTLRSCRGKWSRILMYVVTVTVHPKQAVQAQTPVHRVGYKSTSFTPWWRPDDEQAVNTPLGHGCPAARVLPAPAVPACHCQGLLGVGLFAQSAAVTWLSPAISPRRGSPAGWLASSLENLCGTCFMLCSLPAGGTRAAQGPVHALHLENSILKPCLEPRPLSWQTFLILRKRLLC